MTAFVVHQVRAGRAGASEDFEQMIGLLVRATSGQEANLVFASPGDWGIDVLVGDLNGRVTAWQAKYFTTPVTGNRRHQIRESFTAALRAAATHGYTLERWVLCIPSSMDGPTMQWWHRWKDEQEQATGVAVELWDETRLRELLLRPEAANVYRHYYAPYLAGLAGRAVSFVEHEARAGASEDFEQMIGLLVRATSGQEANLVFASPGDWGIDVLVGDLNGRATAWQPKYFPQGVTGNRRHQIRESFTAALRAAATHGYTLERWVLCIPSSMDGPTMQWWHRWKDEQEQATGVAVELWDETRLRELLLRPEAANVYRHYYAPYLQMAPGGTDQAASGLAAEVGNGTAVGPPSGRVGASVNPPTGLDDVNWLSVVELGHGTDTTYRYELRSPMLGILASFDSKPLRNRAEYVTSLYQEIEKRWLISHGDTQTFQEELREFGGSLFSELFPEPLQEILWREKDRLRHLMVLSGEPFIPWELVHLKEPGGVLPDETRFMAEMGLVRWLYTRDNSFPPLALHARPGRVRILHPDYPEDSLRLPETLPESQFLLNRLGAHPVHPTEHDVRALLRSGSFDILHFAGHGIADPNNIANARILLQGRLENGSYVPAHLRATTVAQQARLANPDGSKPLIVLNACQTGRLGQQLSSLGGFAPAFLDRGAGAFISAMWSVGDAPASTFIQVLYEELLCGKTISTAATKARNKARAAGDGTWLSYAVYAHPHARLAPSDL